MAKKRGALGVARAKAAHNRMIGAAFSRLLHLEEVGRATQVPNPSTVGRLLDRKQRLALVQQDEQRLQGKSRVIITIDEAYAKLEARKARQDYDNPFEQCCNPDDILWRIYIAALGAQVNKLTDELRPLKEKLSELKISHKHRPDEVTEEMVLEAEEDSEKVVEARNLIRDELSEHMDAFLTVRQEEAERDWLALIGMDEDDEVCEDSPDTSDYRVLQAVGC